MKNLKVFALIVGVLTVAMPLFAHHGSAAFDMTKEVTMKATVTNWLWANPHCILQFDAKDESGQTMHWVAETSNPADMTNIGWNKLTLKPGDQITVAIYAVKNGKPIGRVVTVVLPNGQTMGNGFGSTPLPAGK